MWFDTGRGVGFYAFYWFLNNATFETRNIPPAPFPTTKQLNVKDSNDAQKKQPPKQITAWARPPPKATNFLKELMGDVVDDDVDTADAPTEEEEEEELPLKERIFTTRGMKKPEMREAALKLGVYKEGDKVAVIEQKIIQYWLLQCGENPMSYTTADCFTASRQKIDRKRKQSSASVNLLQQEVEIASGDVNKKKEQRLRKVFITPTAALKKWPKEGIYITDKYLRCGCNNRSIVNWDQNRFTEHFKRDKHKKWKAAVERQGVRQSTFTRRETEKKSEKERLEFQGTKRRPNAEDDASREEFIKAMSIAGIPLHTAMKIRGWIERGMKFSIGHVSDLYRTYLPKLLKDEIADQKQDLAEKPIGIIHDATPRLGDFFAMLARFIVLDPEEKTARANQLLFHCAAIKGSLNAETLSRELHHGINERDIRLRDVLVSMNDGCSVNIKAHERISKTCNDINTLVWFVSNCMSHCASNAGKEAGFVLLDLFWSLLQKVFSNSDKAKDIWFERTNKSFPSYNEIRWYSKYEVLEVISDLFPDLITVMQSVVDAGLSKKNASKLLLLLLDEKKSWQLKIELSAYKEGLEDIRNLCYFLEGNGTDIPFKVGRRLDELHKEYNGGNLKKLPTTDRLIQHAIGWATDNGHVSQAAAPPRRTVAHINAEFGPLPNVQHVVQNASRAGESAAQRCPRLQVEAATRALAEAEEATIREASRIVALEAEANLQANNILMTIDAWQAHIVSGIGPTLHYLFSRIFHPDGDRYVLSEFFFGARIFDPTYAKNLSQQEANVLINKMRSYPILSKGNEEDTFAYRLRNGFKAYKQRARFVIANFDKDNYELILSWHYKQYLVIDDERNEDRKKDKCRYCGNTTHKCKCHKHYKVWFEAACLVALVMPSSAAAERVFSLLRKLFSEQQKGMLSDSLFYSLYLSSNKRSL